MSGDTNPIARKRGHHHGNARAALIRAASDMLEGTGASALSIRGIAERAGLSRQAPYNHFADKEALLAALVVAGFDRLAREMDAASADLSGKDALAGAGAAYIAFAQGTPALFRLMFSCDLVDIARFSDAADAGARAFARLTALVATVVAAERVEAVSLTLWCVVHGYATLCIELGLEQPDRRGERARQFADLIVAATQT